MLLFFMAQEPLERQGLHVTEDLRSNSDTPHSVGHLWTSDLPVAETLTTHNTHMRQTSMPQSEFESTIPAIERPPTHSLDRAATGIGQNM